MSDAHDEPSKLYHYTDAHGLIGIVQPSWPHTSYMKPEREIGHHRMVKLLTSDVRFMNDTEELKFGTRLLRDRLEAASVDMSISEEFRTAFKEIAPYIHAKGILEWPVTCFATCFSADGDLLSQWRGYAGGTGGFALGLDRDGLETRTCTLPRDKWPGDRLPESRPKLEPVVYGKKAAIAAIDKHIQELMDSDWKSVVTDRRPETLQTGRFLLFSMLARRVATIKAKAFREEKEWRLFSLNDIRFPVHVRARTRGLVPYVNVAVNMSQADTAKEHEVHWKTHPTIVDLVVGPGPEQAEQVVAARELLKGAGHDPEVVRPSKVTYRG
jgi:hypothetical protein